MFERHRNKYIVILFGLIIFNINILIAKASRYLFPDDPRESLQPLYPGYKWAYTINVKGEPICIRWYTLNFNSGSGFSSIGLLSPFEEVKQGEYKIRYIVTDDRKIYKGIDDNHKGIFYKMQVVDESPQKLCIGDEVLYWGRWQNGSFDDLAICEIRSIGQVGKQLMEQLKPVTTSNFNNNYIHFRYLSTEALFNWPQKGELALGSLNILCEEQWHVHSRLLENTPRKITVPSGTFLTIPTIFEFEFGGFASRKIIETLYYSTGVGLVKWTQCEDDQEIWSQVLTEYEVFKP